LSLPGRRRWATPAWISPICGLVSAVHWAAVMIQSIVADPAIRDRLDAAVGRFLPGWLRSHREDIVQSCLLRLLLIERGRPGMTVNATYLHRMARTATIDHARRHSRETPAGAQDELAPPPHELPESVRLHRRLCLRGALSSGLSRLPRHRRAAVALHLLGYSIAEAARRLGWNDKRAENTIYRGLAQLRAGLAAELGGGAGA
jgi:RNA polymerase sigma-70 factor (ECF subfamily)